MAFHRGAAALLALMLAPAQAGAQTGPTLRFATRTPEVVYDSARDACQPIDTPDIPATAFRAVDGGVVMFALHYVNRTLRGPTLGQVKIDCTIVLNSGLQGDPALYNDRRYLGSPWTDDGVNIKALVHHEYHGEDHGRCPIGTYLGCWHNTVLAYSSRDGGRSFQPDRPLVVASIPQRQDAGQGRHRGFFNPSNIVSDGPYKYFMAATTGWAGQPYGICLFRTATPNDSGSWRAFDGQDFTIRYDDPYATMTLAQPRPCKIIEPFLFAVGSIVRHRPSNQWIAVWMANKVDGRFKSSGFYYATSGDLKTWSAPQLLRAGDTIHNMPCNGRVIAYPSLLDETAQSRNFQDVGDAPWLYSMTTATKDCGTQARVLQRERLELSSGRGRGR